jgi:hypothetical protein
VQLGFKAVQRTVGLVAYTEFRRFGLCARALATNSKSAVIAKQLKDEGFHLNALAYLRHAGGHLKAGQF